MYGIILYAMILDYITRGGAGTNDPITAITLGRHLDLLAGGFFFPKEIK